MKKLLVTSIVSLLIFLVCPEIFANTHYVSPFGGNVSPYTNWATAANTIEDAKSVATSWGSVIIVTNGTYSPGLFQFIGGKVLLQSVNGPEVTIIDGLGSNRCVQLERTYSVIDGFTLTNGATITRGGGAFIKDRGVVKNCIIVDNIAKGMQDELDGGGGVHLQYTSGSYPGGMVSNCIIYSNFASNYGGGVGIVFKGTVIDCTIFDNVGEKGGGVFSQQGGSFFSSTISNNRTHVGNGGGVYLNLQGVVSNCLIEGNYTKMHGGGVYARTTETGNGPCGIFNSIIKNNVTPNNGGGVFLRAYFSGITMKNCLITGNSATNTDSNGGGVYCDKGGISHNCTIVSNTAAYQGGGVFNFYGNQTLGGTRWYNSIIYYNTAVDIGDNYLNQGTLIKFRNVCSTPLNLNYGCITNEPEFVNMGAEDYHLQTTSACINSGTNMVWMYDATDLDDKVRISGGRVDMGVYENPFGDGAPFVDITNQFTEVPAYITSYNIYGTNNLQVAGYMSYTNALSGNSNAFFAVSPWNISVAIDVGSNNITVIGTNNFGTPAYDSVTILRDSEGAYKPWIAITNQSTNVSYAVSTYSIYGTNNEHVVGITWWTNWQSGANGSFPAAREWSVNDIPLAFGTNNIVATGTNYFDVSSFSMIKIYRNVPEPCFYLLFIIFASRMLGHYCREKFISKK